MVKNRHVSGFETPPDGLDFYTAMDNTKRWWKYKKPNANGINILFIITNSHGRWH
jgi:hypothetical protein